MVEETPCSKATAVVKDVTAAEWELGMPPVDEKSFQSSLRVTAYWMGILMNWANRIANNAIIRGRLEKISIEGHNLSV